MKQQIVNYADNDVVIFERFGGIHESAGDESLRQWVAQERFSALNMVVVVVCYSGTVQLRLNGRDYEATAGTGLACLPSAIIDELIVSPDAHIRGFGFSVTALEGLFHTHRHTWQDILLLNDNPLVQLRAEQAQVIEHLHQIAQLQQKMTDSRYFRPMIRSLVHSLLYMLADTIGQTASEDGDLSSVRREQQFKRFVQLLWISGGRERSVSYFANQMCITPKYLSVIVRESCGKTPMQMIHAYSANIIAQQLRSTDKSAKEIARELNFGNDSFFGRYVKQHLGYPPKEYRDKMVKGKEKPRKAGKKKTAGKS